jgi:LPXTG-motif cell wall-anchored protein
MKLKSIAAGTAGFALVAGASLLGAAPAYAADIPVVVPNPIPAENPAGYDPIWFAGNVTGGDGTAVQDETGLVITGGTNGFQLLNGAAEDDASLTLTVALGYNAVSSVGDAYYQISVFGEPGGEFTTLRPVVADELYGAWEVSRAVAGLTVGTEYSTNELITALDAGSPAQVLAFGVFVNPGETATLRGLIFNGDRYVFADGPTLTLSAAQVQLSDRAKPFTLTATGFVAGEEIYIGAGSESSGGLLDILPADADGNLVYTVDLTEWTIGNYTISVGDDGGAYYAIADLAIVADGPALAATGVDVTPTLIGAGILFAAGAAFVFFTIRRRSVTAE